MRKNLLKRAVGSLVCVALILACVPFIPAVSVEASTILGSVTDPGTADSFEKILGTDADGNRYAGRVWVDKSVYKDGDIAILNNRNEYGSTFPVSLEDDEDFQIIFSVLGSTLTTKKNFEDLSIDAFNPISSGTTAGVDDTPLIFVDFIGQYMEIKEIQAVSLFGASYGVVKNADGTYTVVAGTGINPTTNEEWNIAEDIKFTVTKQDDGTQKLEIKINQEILPIIMERVISEVVDGKTVSTITEIMQNPLRVFYTVGLDSNILLPNGDVDFSKIQGYQFIDKNTGTVSFYSNRFGVMNPADEDDVIIKGDAHVGFRPSLKNRYYYHQNYQGIFTKVIDKSNGKEVDIPENNQYGIVWDESKYDLNWMTYDEYKNAKDNTKVYTYVTFYRPTPDTTDVANVAEEVTYLRYADWKYIKESVTFYDANAEKYLNDGKAFKIEDVEDAVSAYINNNPNAEIYAVLGIGSHRSSRLHNMTFNKSENLTNTAVERYAPEYTYSTASIHNGNDVVVWLGNNGRLTVKINTGIALTKNVTENIGNPNSTFALTVTVPSGVKASPVVVNEEGNRVLNTYEDNILTVNVKAKETVYISGIPEGTVCEIGEIINGNYYIADKTDRVTIPIVDDVIKGESKQFASAFVTNVPYKNANLFITKELVSDSTIPETFLNTLFNIEVDLGVELANKTFKVEDSGHEFAYEKNTDANGKISFQIKARQTVEILGIPAGTKVTVNEIEADNRFVVSYRTRNHSGEDADTDNILTIPSQGAATAIVLNKYIPTPVSVDLDVIGTKNFVAEGDTPGGKFIYKVQRWNGSEFEDIVEKTAETEYAKNESGTKTFTIKDALEGVVYNKVGSYSYQVVEVKGSVSNVTYDRTQYYFDVIVTDNGGELEATIIDFNNNVIDDGTYEVVFNNTYHTAPISLDVKKIVKNESGDNTITAAGFEFRAIRTDENWNALTGDEAEAVSFYTDAAGNARITTACTKAGTNYFILNEVNKGVAGWVYSNAEYHITIVVAENNGELTATLQVEKSKSTNQEEKASVNEDDATSGMVSFVNTYNPDNATVNLDGVVLKELIGKDLLSNQFTFYVYEDGKRDAPVLMGKNGLNGDAKYVDFNNVLTFAEVGKYQYDIVEYIPDEAVYNSANGKYLLDGMSYDPTIYDLVVEVTNDISTGNLVANYYFEDSITNEIIFHNRYDVEYTDYTLGGVKVLKGRAPKMGEFFFGLYEKGMLKETVTNRADGSFVFSSITYLVDGVYNYTIKEIKGNASGVRYDGVNNPIDVTVTVVDTKGVLSASANIDNANIIFENTYEANPAQVTFNGIKKLVGGNLEDNIFTVNLYKTNGFFDITGENAELISSAKNMDGAFKFERVLKETGTYYFVIVEDINENVVENIIYDSTRYCFAVDVLDVGDGQLKAQIKNVVTGDVSALDAAVSAEVVFVNEVVEDDYEPETPTTPSKPIQTPTDTKNPPTTNTPDSGDNTHLTLWFVLLFASFGGYIILMFAKRKKS